MKDNQAKIRTLQKQYKDIKFESTIEFTKEELNGVRDKVLTNKRVTVGKENNKYKIPLTKAFMDAVIYYCHNSKTRKDMFTKYCEDDGTVKQAEILLELISCRQKQAASLGYKSYTDMRKEGFIFTLKDVTNFLDDLAGKVKDRRIQEVGKYKELKSKMCKEHGYEYDEELELWDMYYCGTLVKGEKEELVCFELETVQKEMFEFYQKLLQITFKEITDEEIFDDYAGANGGVSMYSATDDESGELLGYFYIDPLEREGKKGDCYSLSIQQGYFNKAENKAVPHIAALICNFLPPGEGFDQVQLTHAKVTEFFHEFGHVVHQLVTRKLDDFCSGRLKDFREVPAQMLEHWTFSDELLKKMMKGSKTSLTDEEIDEQICRIKSSQQYANVGWLTSRQIMLALLDLNVHQITSASEINKTGTDKLYRDLLVEYCDCTVPDGVHPVGMFSHIIEGYASNYYTYLICEVLSEDMFFTRFAETGSLDEKSAAGKDLRNVLENCAYTNPIELVNRFIGRDWSTEHWLQNRELTLNKQSKP